MNFRTAFFWWEFHQGIWIARDPSDEVRRWVIEPAPAHDPPRKFRLVYTFDGPFIEVDEYADDPVYLGWVAVSKKIHETADQLYDVHYLMSEKKQEQLALFLRSLEGVKDDQRNLAPNSVPKDLDDQIPGRHA